jgi:hypothetical protein
MNLNNAESTGIRRLFELKEAEACAKMMSDSEPWITLGRGFGDPHEKEHRPFGGLQEKGNVISYKGPDMHSG